MKKLFLVYGDLTETQGVFDEDDNLLAGWCVEDAEIRPEQHNALFAALGYNLNVSHRKILQQALDDYF